MRNEKGSKRRRKKRSDVKQEWVTDPVSIPSKLDSTCKPASITMVSVFLAHNQREFLSFSFSFSSFFLSEQWDASQGWFVFETRRRGTDACHSCHTHSPHVTDTRGFLKSVLTLTSLQGMAQGRARNRLPITLAINDKDASDPPPTRTVRLLLACQKMYCGGGPHSQEGESCQDERSLCQRRHVFGF